MTNLLNFIILMQPAEGGKPNAMSSLLPLILIIVVFYFFMIRPQMKKQKELKTFRASLKKGDKIVTSGGIYGKIADIKDDGTALIEIATDVRIKVDLSTILRDVSDIAQK